MTQPMNHLMSAIKQRIQNDLLIKHSSPTDYCKSQHFILLLQTLSKQAIKEEHFWPYNFFNDL